MTQIYEACVTSVSQARAAARAGAHRLELCARIATGGLTPPRARIATVRTAVSLPIHIMIRPRPGSFHYDATELRRMREAIAVARDAGADGVVCGALDGRYRVDAAAMELLVRAGSGLAITFHRAFDQVADPLDALETLASLGVHRILTSGGAATALEGADRLRRLAAAADGRIGIIAAGKVRAGNVAALIAATGVREVHAHLRRVSEMRALAEGVGGGR